MTTDISVTIKPADEKNQALINAEIFKSLDKKGISFKKEDVTSVFIKKSIDARHGQIKILLRYKVYIGEKPNGDGEFLPVWKKADGKHKVVIVGSGPAGLYAAFRLLEDGIKPILVERGSCTDERKGDITNLEEEGKLNAQSNFCFGEGGAGTFSDGKLYTRSNKRGDIGKIYRIFVEFGAPERIMTDAHPHIVLTNGPYNTGFTCLSAGNALGYYEVGFIQKKEISGSESVKRIRKAVNEILNTMR